MSSILPETGESRAQIRRQLETSSGDNELSKDELTEIYELLAGEPPSEYWPVYRMRREILDELSDHVDTDLRRRDGHHHTHFRQAEIYHLERAIEDLTDGDGGGPDAV